MKQWETYGRVHPTSHIDSLHSADHQLGGGQYNAAISQMSSESRSIPIAQSYMDMGTDAAIFLMTNQAGDRDQREQTLFYHSCSITYTSICKCGLHKITYPWPSSKAE